MYKRREEATLTFQVSAETLQHGGVGPHHLQRDLERRLQQRPHISLDQVHQMPLKHHRIWVNPLRHYRSTIIIYQQRRPRAESNDLEENLIPSPRARSTGLVQSAAREGRQRNRAYVLAEPVLGHRLVSYVRRPLDVIQRSCRHTAWVDDFFGCSAAQKGH